VYTQSQAGVIVVTLTGAGDGEGAEVKEGVLTDCEKYFAYHSNEYK